MPDSTHEAHIVPGEASAEMIEAIARYGGRCRDCADMPDGICDSSGLPCDPERRRIAIRHVLHALDYYRHHPEYVEQSFTTPSAPPADLEAESRELLADVLLENGYRDRGRAVAEGKSSGPVFIDIALRAIARALSARQIAPPSEEVAAMVERLRHCAGTLDFARAMATKPQAPNEVETTKITSTEAKIFAAAFLEAAALITRLSAGEVEPVWHPIDEAPQDGTIIYLATPIKWKPYKPASEQFKRGIKGRWVESNGYGGWTPLDAKPEYWTTARTAIQGESRD